MCLGFAWRAYKKVDSLSQSLQLHRIEIAGGGAKESAVFDKSISLGDSSMNYILRDTEKCKQKIFILCFLSCLFMKLTKVARTGQHQISHSPTA